MTARRRQAGSLLLLAILALGACELPKPSYTRTMLKVSRSLPGETEELKVRTSEGNLATLIVKRRDKSSSSSSSSSSFIDDSKFAPKLARQETTENFTLAEPKVTDGVNDARKRNEIRKLENAQVERLRATFSGSSAEPEDEKTLRVDGDKLDGRVTFPDEKDRSIGARNGAIDYGSWMPLNAEGHALKQEEASRDQEVEEYRNWRPMQATATLRTITEERISQDGQYADSAEILRKAPFARDLEDQRAAQGSRGNFELDSEKNERALHYVPYVLRQPRPRTNVGANLSKNRDGKLVPPEVIVRSEINVKPTPKRSAMSLDSDGTPVIHGTRMPDDPIDELQIWRNARVINNKLVVAEGSSTGPTEPSTVGVRPDNADKNQRFDKFFKDVNRRYGRNYDEEGRNVYFEWDPRNYKSEALKADVYDHYRANAHKRMLHPDGISNYPVSQRYSVPADSQTIAPVALKPGARAPVLQYAHPELGVQPAKILKNEKRRPDNFPESQHSFTEQRHKKKYVLNDKSIVDSYTTKNYYPNQHFYGLKRPNEPPFWVKISENLKNQFSTGVEKVSQFTRPVIDPLVEATHKISQNLGLSNAKEAQNKIGTVASGTSILIPALGLVASGAALGIGAVAVGRYLDVDVLKRSNELDPEHKRALQAGAYVSTAMEDGGHANEPTPFAEIAEIDRAASANDGRMTANDEGVFLVLQEDKPHDTQDEAGGRRRRRSLDYSNILKMTTDASGHLQRKGADAISEIVEIDVPAESARIDITEFLIPKKAKGDQSGSNTVFIVEDAPVQHSEAAMRQNVRTRIIGDTIDDSAVSTRLDNNENRLREQSPILRRWTESVDGMQDSAGSRREEDRARWKRSSTDSDQELLDALQNLENAEVAEVAHIRGDWASTPCAKRIFCDVMIQRGPDASMLMEKKMAALLVLIQPGAAVQVSSHFEEVMNAVRRHDCSEFLCPQARPGNVFL